MARDSFSLSNENLESSLIPVIGFRKVPTENRQEFHIFRMCVCAFPKKSRRKNITLGIPAGVGDIGRALRLADYNVTYQGNGPERSVKTFLIFR